MEIFKLVGTIMCDTKDAENSISKTSDKAETLGNKFANGVKTAGKWAAGVVAGAAAVGGAMIAAAKDTAAEMDVIDKASQRMGIAAETYQELAYAAELSGVSMGVMEKAAKKLEGTDLSFDDALDQIMQLGTEEERAAKAAELFGDSVAYEMTPLLNAGSDGLAAMRQEANDLGLVMSGESVAAGAAMNDMFTKISDSMSALKNGLVTEMMPYIMEILQWVIDNIPLIKETVHNVMSAIMPIVRPIINAIMKLLPPIMDAIKKLLDWITPYLTPVINGIMNVFDAFKALFNGDLSGFLDGIKNAIRNIGGALWGIGRDIFTKLWEGISSVWSSISSWVSDKVSWLVDKLAFWRKGSGEMDGGNAHAGGLAYVPYDNYPAMLHRGETVLNAANTQSLVADIKSAIGNGGNSAPINITVQSVLDGRVIGESVARYNRQTARAFGV